MYFIIFQLENDIVNLYSKLKTFQLIYNHSEIYDWVNNNFLSRAKFQSPLLLTQKQKSLPEDFSNSFALSTTSQSSAKIELVKQSTFVEWLLQKIIIKGCAELYNVSMLMKLDDENAAVSVSHTRLLLEQFDDKRCSVYKNQLLNLLLDQRHWSTELMIESLWWSLGNSINDTNNLKKSHSPGSPFFLGVSLVKLSSYANVTKLEISIHTLRTEYSINLAEFVVKSMRCIKQYGWLNVGKKTKNAIDSTSSEPTNQAGILVSAKIKDITAYFINHYRACILVSFSEITLTRSHQISNFKFEEFQLAIMRSMNSSSLCLTDFTDIFSNIKIIRMEYEKYENTRPKVAIYIPGNTEATWNSNLHMHCLTLVRDIKELKAELNPPLRQSLSEINSSDNPNNKLILEISAERSTLFEIKLSERHTVQWFFENLFISRKEGNFISAENIFIKIDDQHIFTLKDVDVHSLPKLDMLTQERANCEGFILPTNKVWVTTIGVFKVIYSFIIQV